MVVTLFGESHGPTVGALIEGIPPNIEIDPEQLIADMIARRPGSGLASKRKETDDVEIMSGVHSGKTTGMPILLLIRNQDVRSKDYSFLPYQPRPGHVDHPINIKTGGAADLRGGGSFSARLTAGLVAGPQSRETFFLRMENRSNRWSIGGLEGEDGIALAEQARKGDSLGSRVDLVISGLPVVSESLGLKIEPAF